MWEPASLAPSNNPHDTCAAAHSINTISCNRPVPVVLYDCAQALRKAVQRGHLPAIQAILSVAGARLCELVDEDMLQAAVGLVGGAL